MGIQSGEEEKEKDKKKEKPVIEKLELVKAPGDDDDWTYKTPPPHRPLKRARRTSEAKDQGEEEEEKKKLRWDRVVSVIRDDGNASGSAKSSSDDGKERDGEELKSCIKTKVSKRFNQRIELMNES